MAQRRFGVKLPPCTASDGKPLAVGPCPLPLPRLHLPAPPWVPIPEFPWRYSSSLGPHRFPAPNLPRGVPPTCPSVQKLEGLPFPVLGSDPAALGGHRPYSDSPEVTCGVASASVPHFTDAGKLKVYTRLAPLGTHSSGRQGQKRTEPAWPQDPSSEPTSSFSTCPRLLPSEPPGCLLNSPVLVPRPQRL